MLDGRRTYGIIGQSTASTDAEPPSCPAGVVRLAKEARMAAMKPRTGEGPLEVTKEGRGLVMRVPLEGGGRLVVELNAAEAEDLGTQLVAVVTPAAS